MDFIHIHDNVAIRLYKKTVIPLPPEAPDVVFTSLVTSNVTAVPVTLGRLSANKQSVTWTNKYIPLPKMMSVYGTKQSTRVYGNAHFMWGWNGTVHELLKVDDAYTNASARTVITLPSGVVTAQTYIPVMAALDDFGKNLVFCTNRGFYGWSTDFGETWTRKQHGLAAATSASSFVVKWGFGHAVFGGMQGSTPNGASFVCSLDGDSIKITEFTFSHMGQFVACMPHGFYIGNTTGLSFRTYENPSVNVGGMYTGNASNLDMIDDTHIFSSGVNTSQPLIFTTNPNGTVTSKALTGIPTTIVKIYFGSPTLPLCSYSGNSTLFWKFNPATAGAVTEASKATGQSSSVWSSGKDMIIYAYTEKLNQFMLPNSPSPAFAVVPATGLASNNYGVVKNEMKY